MLQIIILAIALATPAPKVPIKPALEPTPDPSGYDFKCSTFMRCTVPSAFLNAFNCTSNNLNNCVGPNESCTRFTDFTCTKHPRFKGK